METALTHTYSDMGIAIANFQKERMPIYVFLFKSTKVTALLPFCALRLIFWTNFVDHVPFHFVVSRPILTN